MTGQRRESGSSRIRDREPMGMCEKGKGYAVHAGKTIRDGRGDSDGDRAKQRDTAADWDTDGIRAGGLIRLGIKMRMRRPIGLRIGRGLGIRTGGGHAERVMGRKGESGRKGRRNQGRPGEETERQRERG